MNDEDASDEIAYPTPLQKRLLWTGLASFGAVLTGAFAVGLLLLVSWVLGFLQPILVPLAIAAVLAYLLDPLIRWLRQKRNWPRERAVVAVYSAFLSASLLLVFLVLSPVVKQARSFWSEYLTPTESAPAAQTNAESPDARDPSWITRTRLGRETGEVLDFLDEKLGGLSLLQRFRDEDDASKWDVGEISNWLWTRLSGFLDEVAVFFGRGFSSAASLLGYLVGFILVPIYLFFFLKESTAIARRWSNYIPLRRSKLKSEIVAVLGDVNQYLVAYFRGQMLVSLIDGALVAIALSLMGLPYALLLGVLLAVLGLIPYVGTFVVMVPAVIISVVHFGHTIEVPAAEIGQFDTRRIAGEIAAGTPDAAAKVFAVYDHTWHWLPNQIWVYPVIVILIFTVLQQINSLVTAPRIVGNSVGLQPLTVIFSMLFWSLLLGGLLGAILAVPLSAAVKVLFARYIWEPRISASSQASVGR